MKTTLFTSSAIAALLAVPALAQEEPYQLGEIIISGGLSPIEASAYGRSVSTITEDDLDERGITTVDEALRALPGVSVSATGDNYVQVRIRGSEANHTLVLIDGVEMNSSSSGEYLFSGLTLTDVERIEVLRGPQSAIYGSNAMGGVISITTKRADGPGTSFDGAIEVGSFNTVAADFSLRQGYETGSMSLAYSTRQTDGEDLSRSGGDTEYNDRTTLSLGLEHELSDTVRAGLTFRKIDQDYGYDGNNFGATDPADFVIDSGDTSQRDETYIGLWVAADFADGRLTTRLDYGLTEFDQTFGTYVSTGDRRYFKLSGSYALDGGRAEDSAHKLNFVLETETEGWTNNFATSTTIRETDSIALEYQGQLANGLDLQVGARFDDNDRFDDTLSWNVAFAYALPNADIRLRGAIGTAAVKPTMFEQYGFIPGSYTGNPNLLPEESLSYELGADFGFAAGRGDLSVTLFREEIDNLIRGSGATAVNLAGTSTAQGIELEARYDATDWLNIGAGYSFIDGTDPNGDPLVRRPQHELTLNATADAFNGRGTISTDIRYVTGNHDTNASGAVVELPAFTTVDVAATYDLTDTVRLQARVENVFDEDYQEAWGYYGQSRSAYIGLQSQW